MGTFRVQNYDIFPYQNFANTTQNIYNTTKNVSFRYIMTLKLHNGFRKNDRNFRMAVLHFPLRRYIYQLRDFQRDRPTHINIVVFSFDSPIAAVGL